ncbi:MAG: MarR family winged helix-turn-helix transcriptional regulator [Candidatus Thorarchaeota archaeon]
MKPESEGGFLITKIHHLSGRIFSKKLQEHEIEIGAGQGRVIFALWQEDGVPISDLAQRTSLGKSTLTDLLDRLENVGLVARLQNPMDRRSLLIVLTEKAKEMQEEYVKVSREMTHLFYEGFTSQEIETFEGYLRRLLVNLESIDGQDI